MQPATPPPPHPKKQLCTRAKHRSSTLTTPLRPSGPNMHDAVVRVCGALAGRLKTRREDHASTSESNPRITARESAMLLATRAYSPSCPSLVPGESQDRRHDIHISLSATKLENIHNRQHRNRHPRSADVAHTP